MKISISILLIVSLAIYHAYSLQLQHQQQIKFSNQCLPTYDALKNQKAYRYVIYKIDKESPTFRIDKIGKRDQNWYDFSESMPKDQCRYALYDVSQDNNKNPAKIVFVLWSPDYAKVKEKMQYAQNKARFQKEFVGVTQLLQATDQDSLIRPEI